MMNAQAQIPSPTPAESVVYQGQFGEFTITSGDHLGVILYRAGLMGSALSFLIGTGLFLWQGNNTVVLLGLTPLYGLFSLALGISLLTIHIYLIPLHRALQVFWLIGSSSAIAFAFLHPTPLAVTFYQYPLTLLGIGFTFAALTGIFFKEAFCFNRLETKVLTPLVPVLLLGHLVGIFPVALEKVLLGLWAVLFLIFASRKLFQSIPSDVGDKSVFAHLKSAN